MIFIFIRKNYYYFVLLLLVLLIGIFKYSYFSLPFYWDEAWSYAMAVFDMAKNGPTLIPGHANEWFTRGHPLLYYFIASGWLRIFGESVLSAHIFSYILSIISIFVSFIVFKKLFNNPTLALLIVLALTVQSMFLTQCTMLLPEIFLMTLGMLTLFFYYKHQLFWYVVIGSLLVLTKETGIVFVVFVLFDKLFLKKIIYIDKIETNREFLKDITLLVLPGFIFFLFLIIQKINTGYFLFPEHTNMMIKDFKQILINFRSIAYQLLFYQGRNIWTISFILALWGIIKKHYIKDEVYLMISIIVFILVYILFCSINFFTTRYLFSVLPWYFSTGIFFIYKSFLKKENLAYILVGILIIVNLYISLKAEGEGDVVLKHKNSIEFHKKAVNYCEQQGWYDKKIYTGFLMKFNLMYSHLGYLSNQKPFNNLVNSSDAEILIFYSTEPDPLYEKYKLDSLYVSVYRLENNNAWVEIIKRK